MLIGYARVSTTDQNLELQQQALTPGGLPEGLHRHRQRRPHRTPRTGQSTGSATRRGHPGHLETGPAGRNVRQLIDLANQLNATDVGLRSLTDAIDTTTASGRFFFNVMASLAQMERELNIERTRAGLAAARAQGRTGCRKPKMTPSKIESARTLLKAGTPPKDVVADLGVSLPTRYRWIPAPTGLHPAAKT